MFWHNSQLYLSELYVENFHSHVELFLLELACNSKSKKNISGDPSFER